MNAIDSSPSPSPPLSPQPPPAPGFWQAVKSVLAAFFGVQSQANRERDFTRGRPLPFIIVGLAMTVALIAAILLAVRLALRLAGA